MMVKELRQEQKRTARREGDGGRCTPQGHARQPQAGGVRSHGGCRRSSCHRRRVGSDGYSTELLWCRWMPAMFLSLRKTRKPAGVISHGVLQPFRCTRGTNWPKYQKKLQNLWIHLEHRDFVVVILYQNISYKSFCLPNRNSVFGREFQIHCAFSVVFGFTALKL